MEINETSNCKEKTKLFIITSDTRVLDIVEIKKHYKKKVLMKNVSSLICSIQYGCLM